MFTNFQKRLYLTPFFLPHHHPCFIPHLSQKQLLIKKKNTETSTSYLHLHLTPSQSPPPFPKHPFNMSEIFSSLFGKPGLSENNFLPEKDFQNLFESPPFLGWQKPQDTADEKMGVEGPSKSPQHPSITLNSNPHRPLQLHPT